VLTDPEKIIRKGKAFRESTSIVEPGIFNDFHYPVVRNPISTSHSTVIPSVGVFRTLNFGSVPVKFSPPGFLLEEKALSFLFPLK
jgi:hypothetical protein